MKKKKEKNIWRRKICFGGDEEKQRRKWMNIFGKGKYFVGGGKEEWRRKRREIPLRRKIAAKGTDGTGGHPRGPKKSI